jgi:hypothetical protein
LINRKEIRAILSEREDSKTLFKFVALNNSEPRMETPPLPRQEGAGCFAKGCLILVIGGIVLVGVVAAGAWYFYGQAIALFTSPQPTDIRMEQPTDADFQAAEQKLNRLRQATANNEGTTLEFSAADLNTLIARDPGFAGVRNRARVTMANSMMTLDLSAPLDSVPLPKLKGRWFNGTARFGFSFAFGEFVFDPRFAETNGHVLPNAFFTGFTPSFNRSFNDGFRRGLEKNEQGAVFWKRIKMIGLDGDRLVVTTQRT